MRWIAILLLVLLSSGLAFAQQEIPPRSLEKLQDVFTDLRDLLWEQNDEYWHSGQFNRCIATMRLITSMDPHDTQAYEGAAWLMSSDLREADAEAFLIEGLSNNPDVYDLYFELGSFYYFRTRFDEAIPLYVACLTFADVPPFLMHQLAHAYENGGYIGCALETWLEAEVLEPDSPIPAMHIDRIMQGGEPSRIPQMMTDSIKQRQKEATEQ